MRLRSRLKSKQCYQNLGRLLSLSEGDEVQFFAIKRLFKRCAESRGVFLHSVLVYMYRNERFKGRIAVLVYEVFDYCYLFFFYCQLVE